jgi:hypothetical protein
MLGYEPTICFLGFSPRNSSLKAQTLYFYLGGEFARKGHTITFPLTAPTKAFLPGYAAYNLVRAQILRVSPFTNVSACAKYDVKSDARQNVCT